MCVEDQLSFLGSLSPNHVTSLMMGLFTPEVYLCFVFVCVDVFRLLYIDTYLIPSPLSQVEMRVCSPPLVTLSSPSPEPQMHLPATISSLPPMDNGQDSRCLIGKMMRDTDDMTQSRLMSWYQTASWMKSKVVKWCWKKLSEFCQYLSFYHHLQGRIDDE